MFRHEHEEKEREYGCGCESGHGFGEELNLDEMFGQSGFMGQEGQGQGQSGFMGQGGQGFSGQGGQERQGSAPSSCPTPPVPSGRNRVFNNSFNVNGQNATIVNKDLYNNYYNRYNHYYVKNVRINKDYVYDYNIVHLSSQCCYAGCQHLGCKWIVDNGCGNGQGSGNSGCGCGCCC